MIRDSVRMAFQSFAGNRTRAALSLVGVIIGVSSVVAVAALSESGAREMNRQFESFGLDAVHVYRGWQDDGRNGLRFDDRLYAEILSSFPYAASVIPKLDVPAQVARGTIRADARVTAVSSVFFPSMGARAELGRVFSADDEYRSSFVAVLGARAARELFPEGYPVGKSIALYDQKLSVMCDVVGVLAPMERGMNLDWDGGVFIPQSTASDKLYGNLEVREISVLATGKDKVIPLGDALERFFYDKTGNPEAVWVDTPRKWAEQGLKMVRTLSLLLGGIAAISLVVGGIGIMNIMLVSVSERRREIGLRKALGATTRAIRIQFLVEASALTVSGGAAGLLAGTGIGMAAARAFGWAFVASPGPALVALAVSIAIGLASGIYPAARAARLDPVAALSSE